MPTWMSMNFQNSNSPLMEHLNLFHEHSMSLIIMITIMTFWLILINFFSKKFISFNTENQNMELFWTITPSLTLLFIASPSMKLLFMTEENLNPTLSLKITGFQWYWSYELNKKDEITQNMDSSLSNRLLTNSNNLIIPTKIPIRILCSSNDVIHSWTIPSLGIKADSVPGRINQMISLINHPSIMSGQCSEICGANHSFMPIIMKSIMSNSFI